MAQPPSLRAQFPSGPLIDETGEITPVWRAYFSQLYIRTGGAAGASSDTTQLQADLDAEEAARQAADLVLTTGLAAERTAREAADSTEAAARAQADAKLLPLAGGTMTGNIILPAATPTLPRQAVSKSYVDGAVGGTAYAPIDSPPFTGNPTAPTPAPGDADTSIATTAFVAAAVAPAQNNVGRNLIHNALFNVAQRGAGPFTSIGYTLDRWSVGGGGDAFNINQVAMSDANRASIGDEAATNLLNCGFTGGAAATNYVWINQNIEDVRRHAGKTVTISFWANSGAANAKVGVSLDQVFGTGGAPSAEVNVNGQAVTLSATAGQFTRNSVTLSLPSIAGKSLGTAGNSYTRISLWLSAGANFATRSGNVGVQSGTINIWGVQLEIGSVATPLEKPDPQVDLANCQRFYIPGLAFLYQCTQNSGVNAMMQLTLPVTMRASPTMNINANASANIGAPTLSVFSRSVVYFTAAVSATGNVSINLQFNASADL